MKIQIGGLSEGIHRFSFSVSAATIGLGEEFGGDVAVETTLDKAASQVLLTSSIHATAHFACDRCVTPFSAALSPSYTMVYVTEGSDTAQFDPAEIQVVQHDFHVIDISDDVRQTLVLAVPLKLLCTDNCKGLCPKCGSNLNTETCTCAEKTVDPRWEPLRDLQRN